MKNKQEDLDVKLLPFIVSEEVRGNTVKTPYGVEMIKAKNIWQDSEKGDGVTIAVIDSGCDINHESLKKNIVGVRNFTNEDGKNPNIVIDRVGHGTHVVGTIVANGNNNTILGVAPNAGVYVLKAIDRTGSGKISWVVNAIYYAIEKKVDIISMSLGVGQSNDKLERAVKEATSKNIIVVCAAGNEGDGNATDFEYSYPAAYNEVISVGAVDKKGVPAYFSNANLVIDVVAPGVDILSTYPDNKFAVLSGTSMATPHVSGSLALLKNWSNKTFQRNLTQEELYAQLIKHTRILEYPRTVQGNGLVYLKSPKQSKKNKY
ncbi:MAG: S8 family peptidase [Peptostreptococcaceae bacterium]